MWCKCEEEKNNEEGLFGKPLPLISTLSRDCGAHGDQPGILPTVGATWVNQLGEQLHPEDQQESVHCVKAGKFMMICKHQNNWKGNHRLQISSSIFQKKIYNMWNIKFLALFCQLPLTWRPHHYELPLCTLSCAIEIWYRNIPFLISRINYILSLNVPLILLDPLFH